MDTQPQKDGRIRPARDEDLEAICALDARVYPEHPLTPARVGFMKDILFDHPWRTEDLPSLVYEDGDGRIRGFLGVMPRRMMLRDRPLLAGITHRFMVDAEYRGSLAALGLMRTFLGGQHDLSITEPENEAARRIWLRYGGFVVDSQSLQWTKPIRPVGWAAQYAVDRVPALLQRAVVGLAAAADGVTGAIGRVRPRPPDEPDAPLSPQSMSDVIHDVSRRFTVRPVYDTRELQWFLSRLEGKHRRGALRARLVGAQGGDPLGFYVYYARPGGTGLVVQLCARPDRLKTVWRHLHHDAWRTGTVALRGKYDAVVAGLQDRALLLRKSRHTFLLHTRHPEVERAILRGDAFITRLEGEGGIPLGDDLTGLSRDAADGP
jgi:hypothetical protein